ncbi:MAG: rubredoxin [Spirosomaceae bacterium]|jgi:rubredoxin|nr:rubredoxin [Spirosomataceae bacterium]
MTDFYTVRINFKGGVISPAELKNILETARECQVHKVRFGLRQQMIFNLPRNFGKTFALKAQELNFEFQTDTNVYPNIVSSYVAEEVFQNGNWLSEGIYKDIFDGFDYDPQIKINISDAQQSFSPLFSGHLNFVTSPTPNYWYLYIRVPKTNKVYLYPKLIFSTDIPVLSLKLEAKILAHEGQSIINVTTLFTSIDAKRSIVAETPFEPPAFSLPYYEGLNRYGNKTWLGIYRRNELFSVDFLLDICALCQQTKIGEICVTPWKSIIIKGIEEESRELWSNLLFKYSINVRHAANELNWQVEDDSEAALALKLSLVKSFDEYDLRTFGICFGIKTRPKTEVYASIMVRRRRFKLLGFIPFNFVYDISYTEDFNPNGRTKKYFYVGASRLILAEQLRRCVLQYNKLKAANLIEAAGMKDDHIEEGEDVVLSPKETYQCSHCLTVYDADFGDPARGFAAGTSFDDLPDTYTCPTCDAPKKDFVRV